MEWGINDSLKARAYGHKREVNDHLTDKITQYESKGGHYYPVDRDGKLDEWGAIVKHMSSRHAIIEKESKD